MPGPRGQGRGRKGLHKGQRRHFTSPEELKQDEEKKRKERAWRKQRGDDTSSDEEDEKKKGDETGETETGDRKPKTVDEEEDSSSEESSEEDVEKKDKGVSGMIAIENPNRVIKKDAKKVSEIDINSKAQLTRREREAIETEQKQQNYRKLHAAGKTDEARADLARLAIIKKQRDDAAKKRDEEKKMKDAQKSVKKS